MTATLSPPPSLFGLKPPSKTAIARKTFTVNFNRSKTAIHVPPDVRAEQLRAIFKQQLGLVEQFIRVEVSDGPERIEFRITLTSNPDHRTLETTVETAIAKLDAGRIKTIIADGTDLNPDRIEVVSA